MSNKASLTINTKMAEGIFAEIEKMQKSLEILRRKVLKLFPPKYGSETWWEKEITEAEREIKAGKIRELHSVRDLDKPLNELFT